MQADDKSIVLFLANEHHIPVLEEILNEESKQFKKLRQKYSEGKINFGPKLNKEQALAELRTVKQEIDQIYKLQKITEPKLQKNGFFEINEKKDYLFFALESLLAAQLTILPQQYKSDTDSAIMSGIVSSAMLLATVVRMIEVTQKGAGYNPKIQTIRYRDSRRQLLIPTLAHEYTHHIQNTQNLLDDQCIAYIEGRARTVQRTISRIYQQRENDDAFIYQISELTTGELKSVYKWLCDYSETPLKQSLLNTKTEVDLVESLARNMDYLPTMHACGNAYFMLQLKLKK